MLASGEFDRMFGAAGIVETEFNDSQTWGKIAYATAVQADGKVVATGEGGLVRYNVDGSADLAFGIRGQVAVPFASRDVAIQQDGRIVVVGTLQTNGSMAVARFLANGSPDPTFDGDGLVTTDLGLNGGVTSSVVIQPDGKLVVAGAASSGGVWNVAAFRYLANGSLDPTFGEQGKAIHAINYAGVAYDVVLQSDGKIVLAGQNWVFKGTTLDSDFLLVRLLADGRLDRLFDNDGWLTRSVTLGDKATGVAVQANGSIVVAGTLRSSGEDRGFYVARFLRNGATDTTFHGDGVQTETFQITGSAAEDLTVSTAGKVLVVGRTAGRFAFVQYNADGSLDSTFGING